jgi:hypothetical protein
LIVAGYAGVMAFLFATFYRMDTAGELPEVLRTDVKLGFVFAAGVALIGIPPPNRNTARWRVLWVFGVLLGGGFVSGFAAASHYHQYLIRSTLP